MSASHAAGRAVRRGAAAEGAAEAGRSLRGRHRGRPREPRTSWRPIRPSPDSQRRAGSPSRSRDVLPSRARCRGQRKADAGEGGARRVRATVRQRSRRNSARLAAPTWRPHRWMRWMVPTASSSRTTARPTTCTCEAWPRVGPRPRPAGRARRCAREAADPQGDELRRARQLLQRRQVRAARAQARGAPRRRRGPGARARPRLRDASPAGIASCRAATSTIATADAYAPTLEAEGKVIPSFAARRARIVVGLEGAAGDATPIMPDALLDEVTALVEWPVVYAGTFDAAFLDVPQECLILTMQLNQRYFALADDARQARQPLPAGQQHRDAATRRPSSPATSACCARAWPTPSSSSTRTASRRSNRALPKLAQHRLSQQARHAGRARRARCASLAAAIARRAGRRRRALRDRAAQLAKADLVTDMVGEFPELQGLMGRYYASTTASRRKSSAAIEQHYWPRLRRRRAAGRRRSRKRRAGRQARDAGRHVRHRPGADRRQGSVRPAPRTRSACCAS